MAHRTDQEIVQTTHNTARYFTENRHVAWVLLVATVAWGLLSYFAMPKRKDPEIPVRVAAAIVAWPGAPAEKIEDLVTRRLEEKIAERPKILKITSTTRSGVAVVTIELEEGVKNAPQEFDDIEQRLETIHDLPAGTGPIQFLKDFGDTVALMLTVASPRPRCSGASSGCGAGRRRPPASAPRSSTRSRRRSTRASSAAPSNRCATS